MWPLPLLFLIGLAVGSFLNCLVYRLHLRGKPGSNLEHLGGVIFGRSFCPKCHHWLSWKDNIPLLSFALLKGRCRYCHSPISWQYPLVELGTALLFLVSYGQMDKWTNGQIFQFFYYLIILSFLIVISVSDLRYGTIPDKIIYPAIGFVILYSIFNFQFSISNYFFSGFGAAGFFLFLVLITRGKGMGMGDVKLAALMGLVLGWPKIVVGLYLAFLTGAMVGVILILLGKKRFGEHIPFGPFLTASTFIALFWGEKIWQQISVALL